MGRLSYTVLRYLHWVIGSVFIAVSINTGELEYGIAGIFNAMIAESSALRYAFNSKDES